MTEPELLAAERDLIDEDLANLRGYEQRDRTIIDPLLDRRNEIARQLAEGTTPA